MPNLYLSAMSAICAAGSSHDELLQSLFTGDISGIQSCDLYSSTALMIGVVDDSLLPAVSGRNLRGNRLLAYCYEQIKDEISAAIDKYSAKRIGIVLGSSNGGVHETYTDIQALLKDNHSNFNIETLEIGSPSSFLAKHAAVSGPAYTISTACSSSAKAFNSAARLIEADICDAVIVGGTDGLCDFAVNGFSALEAMSPVRTNPFSKNREGINIGEGAALFLLSKEPGREGIQLLGVGESSDAYHMTSPHPDGEGAITAIKNALAAAKLSPEDIDYINLHGTGTQLNDSMESKAVNSIFGADLPCSSTKALTGHTLGTCGAVEAAFCWLVLLSKNADGLLPVHAWDGVYDPELPRLRFVKAGDRGSIRTCLSNSFAFGGSNAAVILGRR